jgi:glutamate-1-semialdehyde 2,1-aminomutase
MSNAMWNQAQKLLPGGVNSPVRAFGSVGSIPIFIESAFGSKLKDTDGKEYIDFIGSWGPMILGHSHPDVVKAIQTTAALGASFGACSPLEVEFAQMVCDIVPCLEMIRMVNSGTEATMSAVRLARGYTGKNGIIKFRGCYHGHGDSFLIEAGSGALTHGVPSSAGVTPGSAQDTLLADYNDLESVEVILKTNVVAAVIVEPVPGNMGIVLPKKGFLSGLRDLCDKYNAVLIFDEVMTGFRLSSSGAEGLFKVSPDLVTFGKIIGGGLPVGGYGGKKEIMHYVSPLGPVYQAGTLSGNPLAMAAGIATLKNLTADFYKSLEEKAAYFGKGLATIIENSNHDLQLNRVGSMLTLFFSPKPIKSFADTKHIDTQKYGAFFQKMLSKGIYLPPSAFESLFISNAHSLEDLDNALSKIKESLAEL